MAGLLKAVVILGGGAAVVLLGRSYLRPLMGVAQKQMAALETALDQRKPVSYDVSTDTLARFRGVTATDQAARRLALAFKVAESSHGLLTTLDAERGVPRSRMVDTLVRPDSLFPDGVIWIGTRPSTRKVRDISKSDQASMTYVSSDGEGFVEIQGAAKYVADARTAPPGTWKTSWETGAHYKSTQPEHFGLIAFFPKEIEIVLPARGVETERDDWKPYTLVADSAEKKWVDELQAEKEK